MKLIIDIPEEFYNACKEWVTDECANIEQAIIADGTPLPKGHGDLIDRDVAYEEYDKACLSWEGGLLKYVPTVIPAERGESK